MNCTGNVTPFSEREEFSNDCHKILLVVNIEADHCKNSKGGTDHASGLRLILFSNFPFLRQLSTPRLKYRIKQI